MKETKEEKAKREAVEAAAAKAQALQIRKAANLAKCQEECKKLNSAIHVTEHKDRDGNTFRVYARHSHRPQELEGAEYRAIPSGRWTLVPAKSIPDEVEINGVKVAITTQDRLNWNRVKRDMAQRMALDPTMTVDAIAGAKDATGRKRGLIRMIETEAPVRESDGAALLAEVTERLAKVEL